jgi:hypothetical protein
MVLNFSPVGDFELVADGLEAHTLRERDGVEYLLTKVLRQEIDRKEVWASNGHYRSGDAVFHLSTTEHATEPSLGAVLITAAAEEFHGASGREGHDGRPLGMHRPQPGG